MSSSFPSLPESAQRAAPGLARKPEADARLSPATPAGGADGTALSPPAAARQRGVVASVKDGYGFIRCASREGQLFFHGSEVTLLDGSSLPRGALTELLRPQQPVEFTVQEAGASRSGKTTAVAVRVLPASAAAPAATQQAQPGAQQGPRLTGTVVRELRGGARRRADAYGGRVQAAAAADEPLVFDFSGLDVDEAAPKLSLNDTVSFIATADPRSGEPRATAISLLSAAAASASASVSAPGASAAVDSSERLLGRVATLRETFGFVRQHGSPATGPRLFFHCSQVEGGERVHVGEGTEVSFVVGNDRRTGKVTAQQLRVLPPGSLPAPPLDQTAQAPPPSRADACSSWARPAAAGCAPPAPRAVTPAQTQPPLQPAGAPPVAGGTTPPLDASRQLGAVAVLKDTYGFIKCCSRPTDLFFHLSAVESPASDAQAAPGAPPTLRPGMDVEFSVSRDARAGKPLAVRVTLAAPGSAVFEDIAEGVLRGTVTSKVPVVKGGYPPAGEGGTGPPQGSLSYTDPATAATVSLPFTRADLAPGCHVRPGDLVQFRVAVDRRTGGARATRVSQPLRTGCVHAVKESYGFIASSDGGEEAAGAAQRVFFHFSEVEGHPAVALKERDEVTFTAVLNPKTGELNARQVKRTLEAPAATPPLRADRQRAERAAPAAEEGAERQGSGMVGTRTVRIVEGPAAGAVGFGLGRGKPMLSYGSQSNLRASAPAFEPTVVGGDDAEKHADAEE